MYPSNAFDEYMERYEKQLDGEKYMFMALDSYLIVFKLLAKSNVRCICEKVYDANYAAYTCTQLEVVDILDKFNIYNYVENIRKIHRGTIFEKELCYKKYIVCYYDRDCDFKDQKIKKWHEEGYLHHIFNVDNNGRIHGDLRILLPNGELAAKVSYGNGNIKRY